MLYCYIYIIQIYKTHSATSVSPRAIRPVQITYYNTYYVYYILSIESHMRRRWVRQILVYTQTDHFPSGSGLLKTSPREIRIIIWCLRVHCRCRGAQLRRYSGLE